MQNQQPTKWLLLLSFLQPKPELTQHVSVELAGLIHYSILKNIMQLDMRCLLVVVAPPS